MRKAIIKLTAAGILSILFFADANAQLSLKGQLRTRTELRDGQGAPLSKGLNPALFTSQRTRLNILLNTYRLKFSVSIQDVRVWGQDVSTINRFTTVENNGLLLHEAWAEIQLTDTAVKQNTLNLKIGRQELIYDDQRLLGNLDWLQQGRRHDAAVLKFENKNWSVHAAVAYNQNKENISRTIYNNTPPGNYTASTNGGAMYKSLGYLYAGRKLKNGNLSFLFFSDQFNKYHLDSVKTFTGGSWARATTGIYFINSFNKLDLTGAAYYQFGKNYNGKNVRGALLSLASLYKSGRFSVGPGIDFTSGGSSANYSKTFDPLYGTPHKFWGMMDYFYAGSPFGNTGLIDYYLKTKLKTSDRLSFTADLHHFESASSINGFRNKEFGDEIDAVASYNLTKNINIEWGYSHFISTSLLTSANVKNVANARSGANWAYIMINVKPEFLLK